jgi:hypothetical protein
MQAVKTSTLSYDQLGDSELNICWHLIFTIFNEEAHFGGPAFLVGDDE